jgi:hypothetical protein
VRNRGLFSPSPSAVLLLAGWFQAANARYGFDSSITRRVKRSSVDSGSGLGRLRRDLDERFSPFVLSHFQLTCGLTSSSFRRQSGLFRPAHGFPFEAA